MIWFYEVLLIYKLIGDEIMNNKVFTLLGILELSGGALMVTEGEFIKGYSLIVGGVCTIATVISKIKSRNKEVKI